MLKQSIGITLIQIFSLLLSLYSVFYVAANISPETYSLLAVNNIIASIYTIFSNVGFETYAIRNVLAWKKEKNYTKIKKFISQTILLRIVLAFILQVPVIIYIIYISHNKFDGQFYGLFILMSIAGIFSAVKNSSFLLLKSFNKYFYAIFIEYSISIFGKIISLFMVFMRLYCLSSYGQ